GGALLGRGGADRRGRAGQVARTAGLGGVGLPADRHVAAGGGRVDEVQERLVRLGAVGGRGRTGGRGDRAGRGGGGAPDLRDPPQRGGGDTGIVRAERPLFGDDVELSVAVEVLEAELVVAG